MRFIILTLFSSLFAASCVQDVNFNQDDFESQIDISSEISPDNFISALVSTTPSLAMGDERYFPGSDGEVRIDVVEDNDFYNLRPDSKANGIFSNDQVQKPKEGYTYNINISIDGRDVKNVSASTTIPFHGDVLSHEQTKEVEVEFEPNSTEIAYYNVEVTLELSQPEGRNFYHLMPYWESAEGTSSKLVVTKILNGDNACSTLVHRGGVMIDPSKLIDNKLTLTLRSKDPVNIAEEFNKIDLLLKTVTQDYYDYHNKVSMILEAETTQYADPITITSNIENGVGLFTGYSTSNYSFEIE